MYIHTQTHVGMEMYCQQAHYPWKGIITDYIQPILWATQKKSRFPSLCWTQYAQKNYYLVWKQQSPIETFSSLSTFYIFESSWPICICTSYTEFSCSSLFCHDIHKLYGFIVSIILRVMLSWIPQPVLLGISKVTFKVHHYCRAHRAEKVENLQSLAFIIVKVSRSQLQPKVIS